MKNRIIMCDVAVDYNKYHDANIVEHQLIY